MGEYDITQTTSGDTPDVHNRRLLGLQALDAIIHNRGLIARNGKGCGRAGLESSTFLVFFTRDFELFMYPDLLGDYAPPARVDDLAAIAELHRKVQGFHWLIPAGETPLPVELPMEPA